MLQFFLLREPPWGLALAYSSHLSRTFESWTLIHFDSSPIHSYTVTLAYLTYL